MTTAINGCTFCTACRKLSHPMDIDPRRVIGRRGLAGILSGNRRRGSPRPV